jgi:uncharacterized protein (TIGR03435 family)
MNCTAVLFLFATAAAQGALHAQTPELRFEVASVKPNRTGRCFGRWDFSTSHGTLTAQNAPLLRIISRAYNLTDDRVSGPAWLESQCYDIRAKASKNASDQDLMRMLQTLLRERFHLEARPESAERPIFSLVVDKGGLKLQGYSDSAPPPPANTEGKVLFMARHLPDLCERIGKVTGRPVINKTGLDGDYMIVLTYFPSASLENEAPDSVTDMVTAVRDQLGLRLESQRGVVEILKIAAVDKLPTGN